MRLLMEHVGSTSRKYPVGARNGNQPKITKLMRKKKSEMDRG